MRVLLVSCLCLLWACSEDSGSAVSLDEPDSSVSETFEISSSEVSPFSSATAVSSSLADKLSSNIAESSSSEIPVESSSGGVKPISSSVVFDFYRGADISTVQEYEHYHTRIFDVDGSETDIFTLLKRHGFNAIRLKTFVSPSAQYGYASAGCGHAEESYGDKEHVVAYAQKVKAAGMAFLLDIHYSDNWADPAKQIIPSRWRGAKTSDEMADSVYKYTYDLISALKKVNATPDMVQIGNETTPGILIHVPNSETDCWGNGVDKASTIINGDMGTSSGKANAAKYFKAGIRAVKAVSPQTKTVLHIESIRKPQTVNWWMEEIFKNQKVPAEVMGFSAYTAYGDGPPKDWKNLFEDLSSKYPDLEFIVAEYNGGDKGDHYEYDGSRKHTDQMVRGLDRWIGAFLWEPTQGGDWGAALFEWRGNDLYADKKSFDEYDP
jgi:arabinogalactan endo-1,4-beta-galactosidase